MPDAGDDMYLVDPELRPLISTLPVVALTQQNLASFRNRPVRRPLLSEAAKTVTIELHQIERGNGSRLRLFSYQPEAPGPLPAILHMHAGGFVSGVLDGGEVRPRELAATLNAVIISVDYRLAPETRYPGALDDCYAALGWLVSEHVRFDVDVARIALKGESAGGGLAAALALLARDRGEFAVLGQHLTYPMLDDRTALAGRQRPKHVGVHVWTPSDNAFSWEALLGAPPGSVGVSPYAAPARATDVAGLPPTFLTVGALDLFVREGMDFAQTLLAAGVPVELHVYPGAFHGFDLVPNAAVAIAARTAAHAWLRRLFNEGRPLGATKDKLHV